MSGEAAIEAGVPARAEPVGHLLSARGKGEGAGVYILGVVFLFIGCALLAVPLILLMSYGLPKLMPWLQMWMREPLASALTGALGLALFLGTVATIIPVLRWLMPWLHGRAFGELIAPDRRLDWGLAARASGLFGLILGVPVILDAVLISDHPLDPTWRMLPLLLVVAAVPLFLQVTAEELFFRGYLSQGLGLVIRRPWVIFVLVSLFFSAAHVPVWIEGAWHARLGFFGGAMLMSWAAWRAGRLEPAIGIHFANNCVALLFFQISRIPEKPSLLAFDPEANITAATLSDMAWEGGLLVWSWGLFWYLGFKRDWLRLERSGEDMASGGARVPHAEERAAIETHLC